MAFSHRLFRPSARRLSGDYRLLANRWTNGHYHWLMDTLPKMSVIESFEELTDTPLIVHAALRDYQRDTLEIVGVSSDRIVNFQERVGRWIACTIRNF